jgi:hypothetical protein
VGGGIPTTKNPGNFNWFEAHQSGENCKQVGSSKALTLLSWGCVYVLKCSQILSQITRSWISKPSPSNPNLENETFMSVTGLGEGLDTPSPWNSIKAVLG